jgi:CubicO group peptidase (beta-lactamase class C family)
MRRLTLITLILATLTLGQAFADERRAISHGEAFMAAFNDGSDAALDAFVAQHSSRVDPARFRESMARHRSQGGLLERAQVRTVGNGRAVFVTARRTTTGAWQTFQFTVDAANEDRLQLIFIADALEPYEPPNFGVNDPRFPAWMDGFVARLAETQPFYGAIVIRQGDRTLYSRAFGLADVEGRRPNTLETRFGMASGSKMFTAVAIMQLVERGEISLTDPISRLVPETARLPRANEITVRHLLNHTSGIGNYWDATYEADWANITTLNGMLPHIVRNWGQPQVGGEFSYSNTNYALLGIILERKTGRDFEAYLQEHIFTPAGMTHTGFPVRVNDATLARGYDPVIEAGAVAIGRHTLITLGARGSSAGGASATVGDVLAFDTALRSGRLVSPATLAQMRAMQSRSDIPTYGYGYGFIIEGNHYGHGGSSRGTQFEFQRFEAQDTSYVVASNFNTIAGPEIASLLNRVIGGD